MYSEPYWISLILKSKPIITLTFVWAYAENILIPVRIKLKVRRAYFSSNDTKGTVIKVVSIVYLSDSVTRFTVDSIAVDPPEDEETFPFAIVSSFENRK